MKMGSRQTMSAVGRPADQTLPLPAALLALDFGSGR